MIILTIRTDKPEAEVGLFDNETKIVYDVWHADRQLAATIHHKIEALLQGQHKEFKDIEGIVCFQGPGSFTGLRIGLTVADTLAYGLKVPLAAAQGEDWARVGISRLLRGENDSIALPYYGAPVHITPAKK